MRHIGLARAHALAAAGIAGLLGVVFAPALHGASANEKITPPVAHVVPKVFVEHGNRRTDNYDWLRKREDPKVVSYLKAENAYTEAQLARLKPLIAEIATEIRSRATPQDASVPYLDNGYFYQRRFDKGARYPVIVRRKDSPDAPEETVLDIGALAANHMQYLLGNWVMSPDAKRVAFAVDFTGNRTHRIFIRTLATGEVTDQGIKSADADLVFSADGKTLFYVRIDPKTVRPHQVWRHRIGADPKTDVLVFEEKDPAFAVGVTLSRSRKFIFLDLNSQRTSESRYLPADKPLESFRLIEPRRHGARYEVEHVGDKFYIRTNLDAPDFRLMTAPQQKPDAAHWQELLPEKPGIYRSGFEVFDRFIAVGEEHDAIKAVRVYRLADMKEMKVPRADQIGVTYAGSAARNPASTVLRMNFSTPLQPTTTYDFDMDKGTLTLRKRSPAFKWFRPEPYAVKRIHAVAPDGARVPVTLVYRKDKRRPGGNPTVVTGYGGYGSSSLPSFYGVSFSLIDRGFVYAIAHVRGGREFGQRWHDQGRMLNKRNTFTDFIAATEALITQGYADPKATFAEGASAGGLLVGAVANMRPDLYAGIVAQVPFVDIVTSMSDPSIPLTTFEYEEWGNPAVPAQYAYMLSYSPYDNVRRQAYPAMFVTAGFHDTQVSYAEPAKWVARLRATKTDEKELLLKTNLGAGHSGDSGRLGSVVEQAEIMAWLINHAASARQQ